MPSVITLSLSKLIFSSSSSSSLLLPPTSKQPQQRSVAVSFPTFTPSLGFSCSCNRNLGSGLSPRRRITKVWGTGGDPDLEAEVLEFMKDSRNPDVYPTKEELIVSGRTDLAKRIVKQGSWLSFGWDLDDGKENEETLAFQEMGNGEATDEFLRGDGRVDQTSFDGAGAGAGAAECDSLERSEAEDSSHPPSSSGRMEDAGIDGILSRLEKERTQSYGFGSNKGSQIKGSWNNDGKKLKLGTQQDNGSENSSLESWSSGKDIFDDTGRMHFSDCGKPRDPLNADMWRKWSIRRDRVPETEFEAAEFGEDIMRNDEIVKELSSNDLENDYNHIRSCLQEMELELDSVLQLLKCTTDLVVSDKVLKYSPKELHSLSDAWEFWETEIIKAKNKLRSIQAQVAVLDGKKALKIIETQQMVAEKEKKIRARQKALSLLRTACVTWPKPASEVWLVGSFDGWTSQRKMERTSVGIFSMTLKLYPGRYEIKFIVDGMWAVDPLRPVVNNNGHQNNILIVS